jgi:hypothetical protein
LPLILNSINKLLIGIQSLSNPAKLALPAFKSYRHCAVCFSKDDCLSETSLAVLITGRLALAVFQKLTVQLQEICKTIGAKDLNSFVFKSFLQIQKILVLNS